jgi:hypothetical protein
MPGTDADDDFEGTAAPTPATPPAKPRFRSVFLRDAEELGIDQADIDECETNADLQDLIRYEREKQSARRAGAPAREGKKPTPPEEAGTAPSTQREPGTSSGKPALDDDWEIEDPDGWIDERVKAEMKKLGKAIKAAQKGSAAERVEKLEKLVEQQQQLLERQAARNHPLVRKGNAAVAQYTDLFGKDFDEDGVPVDRDSVAWFNHSKLMRHLFGSKDDPERYPPHVDPKLSPEENVARAVKRLFGVTAPGSGEGDDDEEKPGKNGAVANRIAGWKDSGQATPTNRNGAARTGIPDGSKSDARKAKKATVPETDPDDDDI